MMDRFETMTSDLEEIVHRLRSADTSDPKTDTVDAYPACPEVRFCQLIDLAADEIVAREPPFDRPASSLGCSYRRWL